jgi:hypothetical protein
MSVSFTRTENRSGTAGAPAIRSGGISNDSTSSGPGTGTVVFVLPSVIGAASRAGRFAGEKVTVRLADR